MGYTTMPGGKKKTAKKLDITLMKEKFAIFSEDEQIIVMKKQKT